jgi:16S rRNA (uracil1498-N3)-methyltransferase
VNLILFRREELGQPLARTDARARHLLEVLRRRPGDGFDLGVVDGPRGRGTLRAIGEETVRFEVSLGAEPPALAALHLVVGLPRPQTARRILQEATSLGVARLDFVRCARSDPNYARSTLWSSGEWRRYLEAGAQQAFCTRLPAVSWDRPLGEALAGLPPAARRLALDPYEATTALGDAAPAHPPAVLALGPERGWDSADRATLRAAGFVLAALGPRILRTETAVVAATAVVFERWRGAQPSPRSSPVRA